MKMERPKAFAQTVAPLRNVMLLNALIRRVNDRDPDLPGMACFYGPSGYGKTVAATWNANETSAYWVEMRESWTRKSLFTAILRNMGLEPRRTIPEMSEQISRELAITGRPLLIDEADYLMKNKMIELVRELYEDSKSAIILIGEERLPQNLTRLERVHNRMLEWVAAQPADLREVALLAQLKCPDLTFEEGVFEVILEAAGGRARRVVTDLDQARVDAHTRGVDHFTLADAARINFYTGDAPAPRGTN
ncbi:AAA family ATPase [Maritimibacter alkaliphilus]|uniref:AAA family ATPase n=1 Tax=Maritimibacter alkaliphilus TaxID=404236 RepID=UPI001C958C87|nr:ATP-binding protein [Maritimibacter alkaliphilus]MBY6091047.1 ATP-binding protein [Maritimibacter alkaliphilus]